jgi:hypothetical protein
MRGSFPDCSPSLAVVFCDAATVNQGSIKRLEDVQKQFKNAVGIVVGVMDDDSWTSFQMMIDVGMLRLFRVANAEEAAAFALECHTQLSQKEKFELQTTYFKHERARLTSAETSRAITKETLRTLSVPEDDIDILIDGFPTIRQLVCAQGEELAENSPASLTSIQSIADFFAD